MADDKSTIQTAVSVLAVIIALFSVLFQWKQNPLLAMILVAIALIFAISGFVRPAIRYFRSLRLLARRNRFVRNQFPELIQFIKRFAKLVDSGDGRNLRNIVYYACSIKGDPTDFDSLYSADYLKEIFPLFLRRFSRMHHPREAEFCAAVEEFYSLSASYNIAAVPC